MKLEVKNNIEALQFDGQNVEEFNEFVGVSCQLWNHSTDPELEVDAPNCFYSMCKGNWLVKLNEKVFILMDDDDFYKCLLCGKFYWVGSHWRRLYKLSEKLNKSL